MNFYFCFIRVTSVCVNFLYLMSIFFIRVKNINLIFVNFGCISMKISWFLKILLMFVCFGWSTYWKYTIVRDLVCTWKLIETGILVRTSCAWLCLFPTIRTAWIQSGFVGLWETISLTWCVFTKIRNSE